MRESARSGQLPRALYLPPVGRPRWVCPPCAELDLIYLGWGRRRFGPSPIPRSRHPGWVYFLVRSGRPVLRLESRDLRTRPGHVLVVGPDCASGWTDAPGGVCDVLTWVWRTPPRCAECRPPESGWLVLVGDAAARRELLCAHALCRREVEQPSALTRQTLEFARLQMELAIARVRRPRFAPAGPALRVELALRWMTQNLTELGPVGALCEYLQVSPATLHRLFLAHLGESPAAHHARLRMGRARQLLAEPEATVKGVAYALGYRHPNDFSRAFKKHFGRNPREMMGG